MQLRRGVFGYSCNFVSGYRNAKGLSSTEFLEIISFSMDYSEVSKLSIDTIRSADEPSPFALFHYDRKPQNGLNTLAASMQRFRTILRFIISIKYREWRSIIDRIHGNNNIPSKVVR